MQWKPHLPDDCPPDDAYPTNERVYRLADKADLDEQDFLSYRERYPEREWEGVSEWYLCLYRARRDSAIEKAHQKYEAETSDFGHTHAKSW